jgi:hypothetical protein
LVILTRLETVDAFVLAALEKRPREKTRLINKGSEIVAITKSHNT